MQLLWKCPYTDGQYVTERGWEQATLERCPFHPQGGCGLEKLGTYVRVEPPGTRIARFWCPDQEASISLLPSFLAARMSGTLAAVEDIVTAVEEAGGIAAAVETVHPSDVEEAISLAGALRSIGRRASSIRSALLAIATLMPEMFFGVSPTLASFRAHLSVRRVLVLLRELAERHLHALPTPLGFRTRWSG